MVRYGNFLAQLAKLLFKTGRELIINAAEGIGDLLPSETPVKTNTEYMTYQYY